MTLFLDTSTLLAASGSATGASDHAAANGWLLLASPYVLAEVAANLPRLPVSFHVAWDTIRPLLRIVPDVLTIPSPVVFAAAKDKPVLFTAYASADILLVMDKADFSGVIADGFYGLRVMTPGSFLRKLRDSGTLPLNL